MNRQNCETAVIIEKQIEYLNSFKKIDNFISLCGFYHANRCEADDGCLNCKFIIDVRFLYLEMLQDQENGVDKIQNFFRLHFGNFFSMCVFLKSLAAGEREHIELDKKFMEVLKIWNAENARKWQRKNLTKKPVNSRTGLVYFIC